MSRGRLLDFDDVRRFCASRPVELVVVSTGHGDGLALHAQFEEYGDFFTVEVDGLQYVEVPRACWVGGLHLARWQDVAATKPRWTPRRGNYDGVALVFWDHDARTIRDAPEQSCFTIVAGAISFRAGTDWNV